MLFSNKKKQIRLAKLYSIGSDQTGINRQKLVGALTALFKDTLGELPKDYVIHGPYGISKWSSIKLKTFLIRLEEKGHEKYYSLTGDT